MLATWALDVVIRSIVSEPDGDPAFGLFVLFFAVADVISHDDSELYCTPDRIRTCDRLLRRQMLYPTELQAHALALAVSLLRPVVGSVNACFQKPFNF